MASSENYTVVVRSEGREIGASRGMGFDAALASVKRINKVGGLNAFASDSNALVGLAGKTAHLPVIEETAGTWKTI